jgi:purine-nucleoside phosphorylase
MLRTLGADAVGMSTVLEGIQAHALGLHVLGFSCMTNWAAGIGAEPISHQEVLDLGKASARTLKHWLTKALEFVPPHEG